MAISIETLALARKYADAVAAAGSKEALDKAVQQAVAESKLYTDDIFSHIVSFKVEIVDSLPETDIDPHVIYFLKRESPSGEDDFYYEYMYINNFWELIGSTQLDLSPYWTIEQTKAYIASKEYSLPRANKTSLGGVKIDGESNAVAFGASRSVHSANLTHSNRPYALRRNGSALIPDTHSGRARK